jgi:hypothetical protein
MLSSDYYAHIAKLEGDIASLTAMNRTWRRDAAGLVDALELARGEVREWQAKASGRAAAIRRLYAALLEVQDSKRFADEVVAGYEMDARVRNE